MAVIWKSIFPFSFLEMNTEPIIKLKNSFIQNLSRGFERPNKPKSFFDMKMQIKRKRRNRRKRIKGEEREEMYNNHVLKVKRRAVLKKRKWS